MNHEEQVTTWKIHPATWGYFALATGLLITTFYSGLVDMIGKWQNDEYSHAYILPFVIGFYLWQQRDKIEKIPASNGWIGTVVLFSGIVLYFSGELSSLFILIQYGFLISLSGIFIIVFGKKGFVVAWPTFLLLFFMIPLP